MKKRKNNKCFSSKRNNLKKKQNSSFILFQDILFQNQKDSKISDFFSLSPAPPPPLPQQNSTLPPTVKPKSSKSIELIKNPSKPKLPSNIFISLHKFQSQASLSLLFNEHLTTTLSQLIQPFLLEINKHYSTEIIGYINVNQLLVKLLLQFKTNLIYIPSYLISNTLFDITYSTLSLFQGFNNIKDLYLHYHPTTIQEAKLCWPYITETICNYVENYQSEKALYLYSPFNYINDINHIESICNFLGYKIIRIDETEINKNYKLNKISEATRSQRIAILPEEVNNNLILLETIVNNHSEKFKELNKNIQSRDNSILDSKCLNENRYSKSNKLSMKEDILNSKIKSFFATNTKENEQYKKIQNKLFQYCSQQKTLIFITDTFDVNNYYAYGKYSMNNSNEHKYLMNIIQKISGSKCPIIVLSNSMTLITSISQTMFNRYFECKFNFMYTSTECKYINMYLVEIVLFLHVLIHKYINTQYNNVNEIIDIFTQEVNAFMKDNPSIMFDKIKKISEFIWYKNNLDIESCFVYMKELLKHIEINDNNNRSHTDIIKILESLTYEASNINANIPANNKNQTFLEYVECLDNLSYENYLDGRVTTIANKRFEHITKAKRIIVPDLSLCINIEKHLYPINNCNNKNESRYTFPLYQNLIDKDILSFIKNQDIIFFSHLFNHFISTKSLYLYNEIFMKLTIHSNFQTLIERYNNIHKPLTLFHKFNDDIYFLKKTEMLRYAHFNMKNKYSQLKHIS